MLTMLLAMAACSANQQQLGQQQLQQERQPEVNRVTLKLAESVEALISQAVAAATEPLLRRLDDKMEKLDAQMDVLGTKLNNQDQTLSDQGTTLNSIVNTLSKHDADLNSLRSSFASQDAKLNNIIGPLFNLFNREDDVIGFMSDMSTELRSIAATLSSQDANLSGLVSNLSTQDAKLNALIANLSNQTSTLSEMESKLRQVDANTTQILMPRDCSDLPEEAASGVYELNIGVDVFKSPVPAFCDQVTDGGGWTVFQRRADIEPRQSFFLGWEQYRKGFGNLEKEFWWGLEYLRAATSALHRQYELRVEMEDFDGEKRYAAYDTFRISPECDGYRLLVENYTGDAGDSLEYHSGQKFSTRNNDQDMQSRENCALDRKGGWWYNSCANTNLNGPYLSGESPEEDGVSWYAWRGRHYSLKTVEMKLRPT